MDFKNWLIINEISEDLYKNAEDLGEIPRKIVQNWISSHHNVDVGQLKNFDSLAQDFQKRRTFTTLFGWAVPCKEVVDLIKKYVQEPLYDVMAGTGYWSRILKKAGINIKTSDVHKVFNKNYYHKSKESMYKPSFEIKPDKIKIRRKNALKIGYDLSTQRIKGDIFLSWPPYECPVATDILEMIPVGTRVFYIGEGKGGCTGDLSFHVTLNKNFKLITRENLPNFEGIHDSIYVYEKIINEPVDKKYRGKAFEWDLEKSEE